MKYLTILRRKPNHPYGFSGRWDVVLMDDQTQEAELLSSEPTTYPLLALQEMKAMYDRMHGTEAAPKILCAKCNAKPAVVLEEGKFVCESCKKDVQLLLESK